jgi:hypothetical protein
MVANIYYQLASLRAAAAAAAEAPAPERISHLNTDSCYGMLVFIRYSYNIKVSLRPHVRFDYLTTLDYTVSMTGSLVHDEQLVE